MATFDNQTEILSRLSPEDLLPLKSVCKSWYALINDPKFVTKHFLNSLQHNHIFLKRSVGSNSYHGETICSILKFSLADRSVSILDVDLPFCKDYRGLEIHGHSHGFVCLTDRTDVFLCNPSTREFHKLPPSTILLTEESSDQIGIISAPCALGFGYSTKSSDFKVVRIAEDLEECYSYPKRVEIYDLSKDRWREIYYQASGDLYEDSYYHEGTFYCWACKEEITHSTYFIQTFDMSDEVFGEISVPECFQTRWKGKKTIGVLNGSIVVFQYPVTGKENPSDIWEMGIWEMGKNECGDVSWSNLLTIGPISGVQIEKPLSFVSSDELLMEVRELGQLILYNIKTRQFKELSIEGDPMSFQASFLVESLVSVKRGNNIQL